MGEVHSIILVQIRQTIRLLVDYPRWCEAMKQGGTQVWGQINQRIRGNVTDQIWRQVNE